MRPELVFWVGLYLAIFWQFRTRFWTKIAFVVTKFPQKGITNWSLLVYMTARVKYVLLSSSFTSSLHPSNLVTFVLRTGKRVPSPLAISYFFLDSLISRLAPLGQHRSGLSMGCQPQLKWYKKCCHFMNMKLWRLSKQSMEAKTERNKFLVLNLFILELLTSQNII